MKIIETEIDGVKLLQRNSHYDIRGAFTKPFCKSEFLESRLETDFAEQYYSVSNRNVIRGMHFQIPPFEHSKLVYCVHGEVRDVLVDLRKGRNFGKSISCDLSHTNGLAVYIPSGVAHGFLSLTHGSILVYNVTSSYSSNHDRGILWNSFGFPWGTKDPIISKRDSTFEPLALFETPF